MADAIQPDDEPRPPLGEVVRQVREDRGWSRDDLGTPDFPASAIAAVENGRYAPSAVMLAYLARRLDLDPAHWANPPRAVDPDSDVEAAAADLRYQALAALALLRAGQVADGLATLATAEAHAGPVLDRIPTGDRAWIPFVRGRAYYTQNAWEAAQAALEQAAAWAGDSPEMTVRVSNLLGAVFLAQEQHAQALPHYRRCAAILREVALPDPNLRFSVQYNLGLTYWALHDAQQAIGAYKQALAILTDLADPGREANVGWGLLMAYRAVDDDEQARVYGWRALRIFERLEQNDDAAGVALNLAEMMLDRGHSGAAEQMLKRANWLAHASTDAGLRSFLAGDWAALALRRGDLPQAAAYAADSRRWAVQNAQRAAAGGIVREYPARTTAEALQIAALVAEAQGAADEADRLFGDALAAVEATTFDDTAVSIRRSHAAVLDARQAFDRSVAYYQYLVRFRPRSRQGMRF